jgi:hypothetical protein
MLVDESHEARSTRSENEMAVGFVKRLLVEVRKLNWRISGAIRRIRAR